MISVGDQIRSRRLALRLTQERLAKQAGISTGFLSDLETGKRHVGAENLLQIANALGVSLDFLMTGGPSPSKEEELRIPSSLSKLALKEHLGFADTVNLLKMKRQMWAQRTDGKGDDLEEFDWKGFLEAVKPFLK